MARRHALARLALLTLAVSPPILAQPTPEPTDEKFVGAHVCGSCHTEQYEKQSRSAHARSLHRAADHPLVDAFPSSVAKSRPPDFQFQLTRTADGLRMRASRGGQFVELPVDWTFGAGDHAVTFVSQADGETYLEHYLSYFSKAGGLGRDTGA